MLIQVKKLLKTLFIDIETVSNHRTYNELDDRFKALWRRKCTNLHHDRNETITDEIAAKLYSDRAGIFSEYSKVACVTVGYLSGETGNKTLRLKSFYGHDEKIILQDLSDLLEKHYDNPDRDSICGHNIREFDVPFLCRRMVINGVKIPTILDVSGKKPWQTEHFIDTLTLWKFGDYKNYTSLNLLTAVMGIPSPKDDIDGSQVGHVYWEENDIVRIAKYCEKDVLTVAQLALKFAGMPILDDNHIESISDFEE